MKYCKESTECSALQVVEASGMELLFSGPENSTGRRVISQPSFSQLRLHLKELDLVLPVSKDTVIKGGGKGEMWEGLRIRFVMANKGLGLFNLEKTRRGKERLLIIPAFRALCGNSIFSPSGKRKFWGWID